MQWSTSVSRSPKARKATSCNRSRDAAEVGEVGSGQRVSRHVHRSGTRDCLPKVDVEIFRCSSVDTWTMPVRRKRDASIAPWCRQPDRALNRTRPGRRGSGKARRFTVWSLSCSAPLVPCLAVCVSVASCGRTWVRQAVGYSQLLSEHGHGPASQAVPKDRKRKRHGRSHQCLPARSPFARFSSSVILIWYAALIQAPRPETPGQTHLCAGLPADQYRSTSPI